MRTVGIAEIKASLSAWLHVARSGEEVIIKDRNRPVARLLPYNFTSLSEHEQQMVVRGELTLPTTDPENAELPYPLGRRLKNGYLQSIIDEERRER